MKNQKLSKFLQKFEKKSDTIYAYPGSGGYWSNLSKDENLDLVKLLKKHTTREAILITKNQPAISLKKN